VLLLAPPGPPAIRAAREKADYSQDGVPRAAGRQCAGVSPAGRASRTAAGGEPTWTRLRTESPRTFGAEKLPGSGAWGKGNTAARSSSTATNYRGPPPGRSESSGCDPRAAASPTQLRPRAADLRLRTSAGPVRTRVWWPASQDPGATVGLLLFFVDARVGVAGPGTSAAWLRELSSRAGVVIVSAPCAPPPHAVSARAFATRRRGEMGHRSCRGVEADPGRLFVGGTGIGAALAAGAALEARNQRWAGDRSPAPDPARRPGATGSRARHIAGERGSGHGGHGRPRRRESRRSQVTRGACGRARWTSRSCTTTRPYHPDVVAPVVMAAATGWSLTSLSRCRGKRFDQQPQHPPPTTEDEMQTVIRTEGRNDVA
jgi:hypothetical protein